MSEKSCYGCQFRASIPGDCHSQCVHPIITKTAPQLLLVVLSGESEQLIGPLGFSFNSHGVANGWANFPLNYDPVWMQGECNLHKCPSESMEDYVARMNGPKLI